MSSQAQAEELNQILKPEAKALTFISSHAANANLFATNIVPTKAVGKFEVLVSFAQVGTLKVYMEETSSGDNTLFGALTSIGTLAVDEGYSFPIYTRAGYEYNLQFTAAGTVNLAQVDEVQ